MGCIQSYNDIDSDPADSFDDTDLYLKGPSLKYDGAYGKYDAKPLLKNYYDTFVPAYIRDSTKEYHQVNIPDEIIKLCLKYWRIDHQFDPQWKHIYVDLSDGNKTAKSNKGWDGSPKSIFLSGVFSSGYHTFRFRVIYPSHSIGVGLWKYKDNIASTTKEKGEYIGLNFGGMESTDVILITVDFFSFVVNFHLNDKLVCRKRLVDGEYKVGLMIFGKKQNTECEVQIVD